MGTYPVAYRAGASRYVEPDYLGPVQREGLSPRAPDSKFNPGPSPRRSEAGSPAASSKSQSEDALRAFAFGAFVGREVEWTRAAAQRFAAGWSGLLVGLLAREVLRQVWQVSNRYALPGYTYVPCSGSPGPGTFLGTHAASCTGVACGSQPDTPVVVGQSYLFIGDWYSVGTGSAPCAPQEQWLAAGTYQRDVAGAKVEVGVVELDEPVPWDAFPLADPMKQPVGQPRERTARPLPYPLLPDRPFTDLNQDWGYGDPPLQPAPSRVQVYPDVILLGGSHQLAPPEEGEREIKINGRRNVVVRVLANAITETDDFVDALWRALPQSSRTQPAAAWRDPFGRWRKPKVSLQDKIGDVLSNFAQFGEPRVGASAIENVLKNTVGDWLGGQSGRASAAFQQTADRIGAAARSPFLSRWSGGIKF